MIEKIFEFALRQRVFVLLAAVALVAVGSWSALRLPVDAVPDITNVQVQINTAVPALAPEEIEQLITYPIEVEMSGLERLSEVRSISKFGLSQVTLVFEEDTDIYRARQLIGERLQTVREELPPDVVPKMAPIATGLGEIYHYTLRYRPDATKVPPSAVERLQELKLVQEFIVKPALRTVPGVTEVNTSGGYDRQFVVMPDPARLDSVGLTVTEVAEVIAQNVANAGGSVVEKGGESVTVRTIGRVQTVAEIADLPLKFAGRPAALRVRDVAEVAMGSEIRKGAATQDGEEALLGSAIMLTGENSRLVAQRVQERVQEIRKRLPAGVFIETLYSRTDLVNATIRTVQKNLLEGAILVIVVLLALLGNIRAALIVAAAIPLSLLFAVTGMVRFGVSGNLMSLGAVDFGLIVDGAVVVAENVIRQLAQRQHGLQRLLTREERRHTVLSASKQVGTPTVFGVAIITIVYLPILTLSGIEGKMFKPMALTVVFALIAALILALTLVPVLCSLFLTKKVPEGDNFLMRGAKRVYRPVLLWALRARWVVIGIAVLLFGASLGVFTRLGAEFIPKLDEGSIALSIVRSSSIGLEASLALQNETEKLLRQKFPEVTSVFSRVGGSEVEMDPQGVNIVDSYVLLRPPGEWRTVNGRPIAKDELVNLMRNELDVAFPGQNCLFSQPIELRMNELLEGTRADLAIKVFGDDFATIGKIAGQVRDIVAKIPGAADVSFDAAGTAPVFQIAINRAAMARFNIQAAQVNSVVATALAGHTAGMIVEGNRRYPVVTRLAEADRRNLALISKLAVRTAAGTLIPLGQVADVSMQDSVNQINREEFQRRMAIMVNLRGRDVQSFVAEVQQKIGQQVKLPEGYLLEFGGQFKNLQSARMRLLLVVPAALLLIFLLIFMAFQSVRQALIVFSGIPLAVTGGIFALWARGLPFSISAGVGFIALSGVAVLNGVMMITFINQLREEGRSVREAVIEGAVTRLRPVLMTALGASLGFVPMALATGSGAEVQRPLATVVIGGIITATFLTLVLLPALCAWVEPDRAAVNSSTST